MSALSRRVLLGAALALLVVPFGLLLVLVESGWRPLLEVDDGARDGLHRWALHSPHAVLALRAVSLLGTAAVVLPVVLGLAVVLLRRGRERAAAHVVVAVVGGQQLNGAVKALVDRPRPVLLDPVAHAGSSSFPSGHAQGVAVLMGVLLVVALPALQRRARAYAVGAAVLWAALMGFSRVALGVHYVSDVLAGYALGAAWVLLLTALLGPTARSPRPVGSAARQG